MTTQIKTLDPKDLLGLLNRFVEVYHAAYGQPPYYESLEDAEDFGRSLLKYAEWEGFHCKIAWNSRLSELVGFAMGYTSQPGRRWHDAVAKALCESMTKRWLKDAFEWVELAVTPTFQGQGIGGLLHDRLLDDVPHQTAVLQAWNDQIPATALYQKRGWLPLCHSPLSDNYLIWGWRR